MITVPSHGSFMLCSRLVVESTRGDASLLRHHFVKNGCYINILLYIIVLSLEFLAISLEV